MSNTVDDLLNSVKVRSLAPVSQDTFTNAKLLTLMTEEMRSYVVPQIMNVREDFFLDYKDTAIEANRELYPIVERSIGHSFKMLAYRKDNDERRIYRTTPRAVERFSNTGAPSHFFLMGNNIRILPVPTVAVGSLRQYFFRTQSELSMTIDCTKITAVSVGASQTTFTIDTDLTSVLSSGDKVDLQSSKSPFLLHNYDIELQTISNSEIVVNNSDIEDASGNVRATVDDYICPRFKTNIPQIPVEYHVLLAQRTTCKLYESLGDMKKYQLAFNDLKQMEKDLFGLIKSRVESQPRKVKSSGILNAIGRF